MVGNFQLTCTLAGEESGRLEGGTSGELGNNAQYPSKIYNNPISILFNTFGAYCQGCFLDITRWHCSHLNLGMV